MAIYAGETVRIYGEAMDWDDTPMSPADVTGVSVIIANKDGDLIVDGGEMTYVNEEGRWLYQWDSPSEAGAYSIEVVFATDSGTSVDVRRVVLAAPRNAKREKPSYYTGG